MLNKQEKEAMTLFIAMMCDIAREILDECAMFETEQDQRDTERKMSTQERKRRAKARARARAASSDTMAE